VGPKDGGIGHLQTVICYLVCFFACLMMFNATFNNISVISWRSVLLVKETGVTGQNHRPADRHDITEILLKVALNIIKQTKKETK
jgi:hypothetical protein